MTDIGRAASEFLQLQAAERTLSPKNDAEELLLQAATDRTDAAIEKLLGMHAETGAQAAIKLSAAASHYFSFGGGMNEAHLNILVSECVRFLTAGDLKAGAA